MTSDQILIITTVIILGIFFAGAIFYFTRKTQVKQNVEDEKIATLKQLIDMDFERRKKLEEEKLKRQQEQQEAWKQREKEETEARIRRNMEEEERRAKEFAERKKFAIS